MATEHVGPELKEKMQKYYRSYDSTGCPKTRFLNIRFINQMCINE